MHKNYIHIVYYNCIASGLNVCAFFVSFPGSKLLVGDGAGILFKFVFVFVFKFVFKLFADLVAEVFKFVLLFNKFVFVFKFLRI